MKLPLHSFTSPLRYPGGKGMLVNFVKLVLSTNGLVDGHYVEVYAGGASIAWVLLFEEYVRHVHLNDLSRPVYAFWVCVLDHTEDLCRLIRDSPVTVEEWHRQRAIQIRPEHHSPLELGFSTFFLNRTNRSGILGGGVIGGKRQIGRWKIDARFNKADLIARVQRIARYASRITLYNTDASHFLRAHLPKIPERALVYLDPPYYLKGEGLYENHYSHQDHVRIANLISSRVRPPWIVSYDNAPQVAAIYRGFRRLEYDLSYSAQDRYVGSEVMFFSPDLAIPKVENPSRVTLREVLSHLRSQTLKPPNNSLERTRPAAAKGDQPSLSHFRKVGRQLAVADRSAQLAFVRCLHHAVGTARSWDGHTRWREERHRSLLGA